MSGFMHSLLVLAGLRAPRRAPSARLRGKGGPSGQQRPGRPKPQQGRPGTGKAAQGKAAPKGPANRAGAGRPQPARTQPPAKAQRPGGNRPQGRPAPARPPASVHEALDDVFGDLSPMRPRKAAAPGAPSTASPRPRTVPAGRRPARHRSVSGLGMFVLATLCLSFGGWAGSQVQAYAYGTAQEPYNPAEMRSIEPPNDFKF